MRAKRLIEGDQIAFFSPSRPVPSPYPEHYERGISCLRAIGFEVLEGMKAPDVAASPIERADELNELIYQKDVRAIVLICGTNSNELLPFIDFDYLFKHPMVFIGYSEVSAILLAIYAKTGLTTFCSPAMLPSFDLQNDKFARGQFYFEKILMKKDAAIEGDQRFRKRRILRKGKARGKLIGGHFHAMVSFLDSEYFPELNEAILFIEDPAKDVAMLEELFIRLEVCEVFKKINGLIFGIYRSSTHCLEQEVFMQDMMAESVFPILTDVNFDETPHLFPIGAEVELDCNKGVITLLQDGIVI